MQRLIAELQRLYFHPVQLAGGAVVTFELLAGSLAGEFSVGLDLSGGADLVRLLAVDFRRAADWPAVEGLCQSLHDELELPLPAVSVSARAGFRLWFSLREPVPLVQAQSFLAALRQRYLAELPAAGVECHPGGPEAARLDLVPARDETSGKWSAFIDPGMGSMFVAEPGLEMAPNLERQADMLATVASIGPDDWARALALLLAPPLVAPELAVSPVIPLVPASTKSSCRLGLGGDFRDPQSFLLAVMNDPTATADQRIQAATVLLPYFAVPAAAR